MKTRRLGNSDLQVSTVALGCWPMAGISSLDVNDQDSLKTIQRALDCGINFFDTAYSYGYSGQSDQLLAKALEGCAEEVVIASKVGTHYDPAGNRIIDGSPETLIEHTKQSLQRLGVDRIQLMYLHTPDPQVAILESADALAELKSMGLVQHVGVSNVNLEQLKQFMSRCPVVAVQPYFNMLQQEVVRELRDLCLQENIAMACYWVLMKGLLAGRMQRDHQFDPKDRRLSYAVYQGEQWQRAQDLLDELRAMAAELGCTVSQLVIAWTLAQSGITVALCGAKRAEQIEESAGAIDIELPPELIHRISALVDSLFAN
ncbi:MAG: aldo/keto reductase [Pirellulales bacterium]